MQSEAVTQPVQNLPDDELRLGVLLFDGLHDPSALLRCAGVHLDQYSDGTSFCIGLVFSDNLGDFICCEVNHRVADTGAMSNGQGWFEME